MKEFKTIAEQVSILESRDLQIDQEASVVLLRENYYSVVNGYKDPFSTKGPCNQAQTISTLLAQSSIGSMDSSSLTGSSVKPPLII